MWIAGTLAALDPGSDELCTAMRRVAARSAGLFRSMVLLSDDYPIPLGDGRSAILHNIGVTSQSEIGAWLTGFYAGCVMRDEDALGRLARTPVAELRRSPTRAGDCMFMWVGALQSWHNEDPGTVDELHDALERTDPERFERYDPTYVLDILVPSIEVLLRMIEGDAAPSNEALRFALVRHEKYWRSAERKTDSEGRLALAPLGMASLAHDLGIAVEVESDYLPRRLVGGGCGVAAG